MSRNLVSVAIENVDAEPSNEFLSNLRLQLLADLAEVASPSTDMSPHPSASPPELPEEYIMLAPNSSRLWPKRRLSKILLAAAACIAVLGTAVLIANRPNDDPDTADALNDVNSPEALPLAQAALITPDALGNFWVNAKPITDSVIAEQATATIAALPQCAALTSVGLFPPSTKSVAARQFLSTGGREEHGHAVFVFATPEDASRAMDVIAGDIYPKCFFKLFDRLTPLGGYPDEQSTSEPWDAPEITRRGDRQAIIGQHVAYTTSDGPVDVYAVNAFVQVGRAISWINPLYAVGQGDRLIAVDTAINATTAALESVFGR